MLSKRLQLWVLSLSPVLMQNAHASQLDSRCRELQEQVQSLGADFIAVKDEEFMQAQTEGGYAKQMSEAYQKKQAELVASHIEKQDIVVTTALIPGRPAPVLVSEDMVKTMRPGSVIVDMAVSQGGNCPLSKPDEVVDADW